MPEGVEVRLHTDAIKKFIGSNITSIEYYKEINKMFKGFNPNELKGCTINNIYNKGKCIFFNMQNENKNYYLLVHFSMSGSFRFAEDKHNIIKINTNKGSFYYNDIRHFGTWTKLSIDEYNKKYNSIGPDILDMSDMEIVDVLKHLPKRFLNKPIKQVIMSQDLVSGIGNIYATEALFDTNILPTRLVKDVPPLDVFNILKSAQLIMKESYKLQGMTVHSFTDSNGNKGHATQLLKIYGWSKCSICGQPLEKIEVAGRTTHYCKNCQK